MKKVFWVSRHDLSPAQMQAIRNLHGEEVQIVKDPAVFTTPDGLAEYVRNHPDGFVYAVAGAVHYLTAQASGCVFGIFENHPSRRADGTFGLAAVYHIGGKVTKVWTNGDPLSDTGESLVPVSR